MNPNSPALKDGPAGIVVDLMRGVLAIIVVMGHALESGLLLVEGAAAPLWMEVLFGDGGFCVNGFFVLSGFCIHRSILAQWKKGGPFGVEYTLARITRLYPLYLLALLGGIIVAGWPGLGTLSSHLFMLQGVSGVIPSIKPAWSLTYEAVYYVAWPLVLMGSGWRSGRAFVRALIGTLALAGVLFGVWKLWQGGTKDSRIMTSALIAAQFPLWLGGAWLAEVWDKLVPHVRSWMAPAAFSWIIGSYAAHAWMTHHAAPTYALVVLGWAVVPGWLGLVLGSICWPALLTWRTVGGWLGLLSYPLYILHQPLLDAGVRVARSNGMSLSLMEAIALLMACVMGFMLAVGLPLEDRLLKWRARVLKWRRGRGAVFKPAPGSLPDT